MGVSQQLVTRALAEAAGIDPAVVAHRLMGDWEPTPDFYAGLMARDAADADLSRPYPFFLAYALEQPLEDLGDRAEWQAEWKWDGIRSQLIRRGGRTFLWSRGEELITERYPELAAVGDALPDGTAIDGEILPLEREKRPAVCYSSSGGSAARRLARRSSPRCPSSSSWPMTSSSSAARIIRGRPLERATRDPGRASRRPGSAEFPTLANRLRLSPIVETSSWEELAAAWGGSREMQAEGLMLKRRRDLGLWRRPPKRGDWWKWKVQPHTIDAVLIAAQRGNGKRASLYTDYTFGVWDREKGTLVSIAKAYSGPDRRRDPPGRRLRPPPHRREVRTRAEREARSLVFEPGLRGG